MPLQNVRQDNKDYALKLKVTWKSEMQNTSNFSGHVKFRCKTVS